MMHRHRNVASHRAPSFACGTIVVFILALIVASTSHTTTTTRVHAESDSSPSDVVVLTSSNFDELTSYGSWLVEFYAPWCGHCKTLAPTYEDAARRLRGVLNLGKIDATVETSLAQRYEIKGFPTIKFMREGEVRNYQGARTVDAFVAYAKEMKQPPVNQLDTIDQLDTAMNANRVSIVFFSGATSSNAAERRLFDTLAYRMQGMVKFYAVEKASSELYDRAGVNTDETPLVMAITRGIDTRDASNRFMGPWVDTQLREFIASHRLPLISELDSSNFDEITSSGKRIVYAIINPNEKSITNEFTQSLYPLARQQRMRDGFVFATIDGVKYHKYVSQFNVHVGENGAAASTTLPTLVVVDTDLDYYYEPPVHRHRGAEVIHPIGDATRIESFLNDILNGAVPLTCTTAWWNPTRYVRAFEKMTSKWPTWQVAILAIVVMLSVLASLFFCCFYGMDATDDEIIRDAERKATEKEKEKGAKKEKTTTTTDAAAATSLSEAKKADESGLRSRKTKEQQ